MKPKQKSYILIRNYNKNSFKVKKRKRKNNKLKYNSIYKPLIIIIIGVISFFIFFKNLKKLFKKKNVCLKSILQRKKEKIEYII